MKLFECDFCGAESPHLYPLNDGLWAVCSECMTEIYNEGEEE